MHDIDYLKDQDGFSVPKFFLRDKDIAIFLTAVWNRNTRTKSNYKNAKAALFREIKFAGMKNPPENSDLWPEVTKTVMSIENSEEFRSYCAAKAEILSTKDDFTIFEGLLDERSKIP